MNKLLSYLILILTLLTIRCNSENNEPQPDYKFVPTDVIVKTKGYYTIDKVFEFINGLEHDVESVDNGIYNSDLPSDSLEYVLNYLNSKPYTNSSVWRVGGYLHYQTNQITVFPKLFEIKNKDYQEDWLNTMDLLRLTEKTNAEVSGYIIYFHVPEGQEKAWVTKFKKLDFVEWAEPNYIIEIELY
jgi:hypothetical protein